MNPQPDAFNFRFLADQLRRFLPNSQTIGLALVLIVGFVLIYSLLDI